MEQNCILHAVVIQTTKCTVCSYPVLHFKRCVSSRDNAVKVTPPEMEQIQNTTPYVSEVALMIQPMTCSSSSSSCLLPGVPR